MVTIYVKLIIDYYKDVLGHVSYLGLLVWAPVFEEVQC